MSNIHVSHYTHRDVLAIAIAAGGFAAIMATTVFVRASFRITPNFLQVFLWQLLIWMPWVAVPFLVDRIRQRRADKALWFASHTAVACAIATLMVLWSSFVSDQISPYRGVLGTKYGAFAYFFIFWFFINFLAYWILVAYLENRRVRQELREREEQLASWEEVARAATSDPNTNRTVSGILKVRKNGKQHIIQTCQIDWVEAQDYYAALHVGTQTFLIRKSLRALSDELGKHQFVRVHRSTLVRLGFVEAIDATSVTLADGTKRRVSREGRGKLQQALDSRMR